MSQMTLVTLKGKDKHIQGVIIRQIRLHLKIYHTVNFYPIYCNVFTTE